MTGLMRSKKGIALVLTTVVATVLLGLMNGFLNISTNQTRNVDIFDRRTRAYYLAGSGLDRAIYWLRAQGAPPVGNTTNPWNNNNAVTSLGGGSYNVTVTDLGIVGGAGSATRRYQVSSVGTYGTTTRTLRNYVQADNYARYLWFTNSETFGSSNVWFWSLDYLTGEAHTNSHLNIYKNPYFGGAVSSVDDYIKFYNNGSKVDLNATSNAPYDLPTFVQGMQFGAEATTMPTQALNLRAAASSGGMALTGNTTVTLNSNGTMNVTNAAAGYSNTNMTLPANGALFVNTGTLSVSGALNGRLTIGASKEVIITSDVTYASDPAVNADSDDVLGIISEDDVVIASATAPYDLKVSACIMALNTSFMLENWSTVGPKGTLSVYGGIIQQQRGPVGTFNGSTGTKLSGYSKNYSYDSRLLSTPPPFMPTTGDYITLSWEEN